MGLTPISGEIQSQPLNDNFSYLDEQVGSAITTASAAATATTNHIADTTAHSTRTGIQYWYRYSSEYTYNGLVMNESTMLEAPFQLVVTSATGGIHGGVPNSTGSTKAPSIVYCQVATASGSTGFTGLGSFVSYYTILDTAGIAYDPLSAAVTYREGAAFAGYVTAKSGGLAEGIEVRVTSEGAAPTEMLAGVFQIVKNNSDTTLKSSGLYVSSDGSGFVPKLVMEAHGSWGNGIDLTGATFTTYAMKLPIAKGINFGGTATTTFIASNATGTQLSMTCDNIVSYAFGSGAFGIPASVFFIPNSGVPTDGVAGTGVGYAGKGSLCIDITNANLYINAGTTASVTWKLFTRAA